MHRMGLVGLCVLILGLAAPTLAQIDREDGEPIVYTLVLNDYNFTVEGQGAGEGLTLETGQLYRLAFRNEGVVMHEVLIGRNLSRVDGFATNYAEYLLDDVQVDIYGAMFEQTFEIVVPGFLELELNHAQELAIQFTLSEEAIGTWEIGCFAVLNPDAPPDHPGPTHYDVGMYMPLEVVAAS